MRLLRGDCEGGGANFEGGNRREPPSSQLFQEPQWNGDDLAGRTILLHAEQGLGDTIQFVRYVPLVKERGGTVVLEVQKPLVALLGQTAGVDRLVAAGDELPPFDVHAPLLTLPGVFGADLHTM